MQTTNFSKIGLAAWRWFIADDDEKVARYAELISHLILLEKQEPDSDRVRHWEVFP